MSSRISRADAWSLLTDWVRSPSLRRHCLAVSVAMHAYAQRKEADGRDAELWEVTGLLHDADYERFPEMDDAERGHPRTIMAELERRDAPPEMIHAIASHADFLAVEPVSALDHTLLAVDELCGFLVACAQVRPEGIHGLTPKSVKNKLKQPSFAAAVSRDDVRAGAAHLDVDSTSTSRSSSPRSRSGPASSTCTAKPPRSDSGSRCTPRRRRRGLGRDPGPDAQSRLQPVRLLR